MSFRDSTEVVTEESQLLRLVGQMSRLADQEKLALGFWPPSALVEAINRKAVIAMVRRNGPDSELIGYIHHSGAYPHAKIQQIAVSREERNKGNARALLNTLIAALEKQGYLSIRADIAEDLQESLAFYRSNGFTESFKKKGGGARKRSILVHERTLDTDDLFSFSSRLQSMDLGIRRRAAGDSPIYAFDLNVYFDLVRDRAQSDFARKIFGAALAHELRLAVASEFLQELERTSLDRLSDPILQMALKLPTLPKVDLQRLSSISDYVHELVFVKAGKRAAGTTQALSDAKHLAHAALARAAGFVTRDRSLLDARGALLDALGIDVISTEELADILPRGLLADQSHPVGHGFSVEKVPQDRLLSFLRNTDIDDRLFEDFRAELWDSNQTYAEAVVVKGDIAAVAVASCPRETRRLAQCLVYVEPSQPKAGLFCDHLLDRMLAEVCAGKPAAIRLANIPGQSIVGSVARSKGFLRSKAGNSYDKFALGHPLTHANWEPSADELRRCTGLIIPRTLDSWDRSEPLDIIYPSGEAASVTLSELELLLGPTVLITATGSGVLVPIVRSYADELLGTGRQQNFSFLENPDASFTSRRGYVNSPQRSSLFRPDSPILFYESKNSGGRGCLVAIARIADSLVLDKAQLNGAVRKQLVVDDVDSFSSSDQVLVTTFDCLLRVPQPPSLKFLRSIGAIDGANLVSAKAVTANQMQQVIQAGWEQSA